MYGTEQQISCATTIIDKGCRSVENCCAQARMYLRGDRAVASNPNGLFSYLRSNMNYEYNELLDMDTACLAHAAIGSEAETLTTLRAMGDASRIIDNKFSANNVGIRVELWCVVMSQIVARNLNLTSRKK